MRTGGQDSGFTWAATLELLKNEILAIPHKRLADGKKINIFDYGVSL